MNQPSSRLGGDFSYEVMEEFRAAYAQQLSSPEQDEIANNSGLSTNTVANTSPWYDHVGLWKYPSGKGPEDDLKQVFDPSDFLHREDEEYLEEDDELSDEDLDPALDQMSDEELNNLIDELLGDVDDDE